MDSVPVEFGHLRRLTLTSVLALDRTTFCKTATNSRSSLPQLTSFVSETVYGRRPRRHAAHHRHHTTYS
jgi:hypothetical protein